MHYLCTAMVPMKRLVYLIMALFLCVAAMSCRVTRHIPEDSAVVSHTEIRIDGKKTDQSQLRMAMAQRPYHRTFGFLPIGTWIWHNDTTTYWHRLRQRLGTAPVLYDQAKTRRSEQAMKRVMQQQGYLDAVVTHHTWVEDRKVSVTYDIRSNMARRLSTVKYDTQDVILQQLLDSTQTASHLHEGQLLDHSRLESERQRITTLFRDHGFWDFDKENVSYIADTLSGRPEVDLTVSISGNHRQWHFRQVHFITNFNILTQSGQDSLTQHFRLMDEPGYDLTYSGDECYLRDKVLIRNTFVLPGDRYAEWAVRNTYASLSRLHILKYINIRVEPVGDTAGLDVFIYLTPQPANALQFELDGTNTAGDLGFALGLTYQQRNAFRGSETFTTRLKGSYEALSGNVENLVNRHYSEYAAEMNLEFPQFLMPLLNDATRRKSRATSLVKASFSRQSRPEYTRIVTQGGFGYKWNSPDGKSRNVWDVANLSYVYLPEQSETFKQLIANLGPISYSSYSSHFILSMDYTLYMGNNTLTTGRQQQTTRDLWSLRINPEIAGNMLSAVSHLTNVRQADGRYEILSQPFEQYARFDVDWSYCHYLTERSRLAIHAAGGVAVPYGNSNVMPFEKRYYSGGANSVRGWSVRELGPGRYAGTSSSFNYFNQCGDVRLDASVELRSRLFWKLESAFFVDAGNVWTIKEYESQAGGEFTSDFLRQIASSWGLGLRMVTDFVVLRLDWGFKAYDPSANADESWSLPHPFRSNHNTLHFAVGYPF